MNEKCWYTISKLHCTFKCHDAPTSGTHYIKPKTNQKKRGGQTVPKANRTVSETYL